MSASIAHRGPEAEGLWRTQQNGWSLQLIHRRLRIIDVSERGDQPMHRDRLTVAFNGEIYNFAELRTELERCGYRFLSDSDTEVILHAYACWGLDSLSHLEGMFAFALWDASKAEMLLARDRLGKKPLFFRHGGSGFTFGSEIKAILATLDKTPSLDVRSLDDYLTYLYVPYSGTIFEGIRQLEPGAWMTIKALPGELRLNSGTYWDPLRESASKTGGSTEENQLRLQDLMNQAVASRMVSDVPLGVLLSGGLDSSTITAIMSRSSRAPIRSFSVGFPDAGAYDETGFSKIVSSQFSCDHKVLAAQPSSAKLLAKVIWHFDQPFGNPTAILAYTLAELTKRSVTVALGGDGGDELFGGYPRYLGAYVSRLSTCLPGMFRNSLLPGLGRLLNEDTNGRHQFRRLREFLEHCGLPLIEMYLRWITYFLPEERSALYTEEIAKRLAGHESESFLRKLYAEAAELEPLNRLAYVDIKSFLCCNVLEYSDRMSMAHALELRAPFCDRRLVEFSLRVPFNQKFRFGESKWLLKKAMQSSLPKAVLHRRKLGFNPPVGTWLTGELKNLKDLLLGREAVANRGLFRYETVRGMLDQHENGVRDFSLKIWALMALEIWSRIYQDANSPEQVQDQLNTALHTRSRSHVPVLA
jgi:asparagine synthase (glutamine-hydrolysing)